MVYCKQTTSGRSLHASSRHISDLIILLEFRQLSTQRPCLSVFVETSAKAVDCWLIMISPFLQRPWRWSLCLSPLREPRRRCFPLPTLMPWGPKRTERPSRSCSCSRRSRTPRGRQDRRRSSGTTPASLSSTGLTSRTRSRSWWSEVPLMWSTPSEWMSECVSVSASGSDGYVLKFGESLRNTAVPQFCSFW